MNYSHFIKIQNRKLGQMLMELNYDLRMREKPEVNVSWIQMFGYIAIGGLVFLILSGLLRAWWRF